MRACLLRSTAVPATSWRADPVPADRSLRVRRHRRPPRRPAARRSAPGHPVAAFGRAAGAVERVLWRDHRGWGALHTLVCAGGAAGAATLLSRAVRGRPAAAAALTAAATWTVVGGTSLGREARAIGGALAAGDVEVARERLPHLCGRDPQSLDADADRAGRRRVGRREHLRRGRRRPGVGRARGSAGSGGLPGGQHAGRDGRAQVGQVPRYGWASARLDDVAGWPGARLTAVLAVLAGPRPRRARCGPGAPTPPGTPAPTRARSRPRSRGRSGVRLGGTLSYAGRVEHRPVLNAPGRAVEVADIERAVRLSRRVGWLTLATAVATRAAVRKGRTWVAGC